QNNLSFYFSHFIPPSAGTFHMRLAALGLYCDENVFHESISTRYTTRGHRLNNRYVLFNR
ncbi:hypothetical protein JW960_02735, partial [candidate division KSB1 bacterium]|nr:hypothetical protein [candidate division KSB1 bacterium]